MMNLIFMGIRIVSTPPYDEQYTIDEETFGQLLDEKIGYRSENTRNIDIRSLSAIHHIRKGKSDTRIEHSKAVFVTDNQALARVSKKFFEDQEKYKNDYIPHCLPAQIFKQH